MSRSLPEWVGKSDDTPIPPRVRLRVFEAHGGVCYLSKRKIAAGEPWDCDHVIALINGGQNRESNLAPALKDKHHEKTAQDVDTKSKTYRMQAKHNGTWPKSETPLRSRGFASSRGKPPACPSQDGYREAMNPNQSGEPS